MANLPARACNLPQFDWNLVLNLVLNRSFDRPNCRFFDLYWNSVLKIACATGFQTKTVPFWFAGALARCVQSCVVYEINVSLFVKTVSWFFKRVLVNNVGRRRVTPGNYMYQTVGSMRRRRPREVTWSAPSKTPYRQNLALFHSYSMKM